ncbi:arginine repressor [Schleiferilactobacillus perolens]|jgi:transcriptional regulator of arginine metabolism|uniref:arginine repressor n=1 Tax=Schleiferilactobacillus perolens TaxID=100468 RepID=UPI0023561508|nr:hypothetical protein [Schleiferilactobacillus perolens]MCI1892076.1 hypothetical protein [Schleiferilactobacillus harbinensis]MCI1911782.1 hypothetical protein [Schleiferilactobacillus harbinensis]MCI2172486.1 hypothetical protein [Schleiferilactobacillus perolens]
MNTADRRGLIARLISDQVITRQIQLRQVLQRHAVVTTQATLSRDLAVLGAVKRVDSQGQLRYMLPNPLPPEAERRLKRALIAAQATFDQQAAMIAIHTHPGAAPAVATTLRMLPLTDVFIVLSDDAGVLLVCREEGGAKRVLQWLKNLQAATLSSLR